MSRGAHSYRIHITNCTCANSFEDTFVVVVGLISLVCVVEHIDVTLHYVPALLAVDVTTPHASLRISQYVVGGGYERSVAIIRCNSAIKLSIVFSILVDHPPFVTSSSLVAKVIKSRLVC